MYEIILDENIPDVFESVAKWQSYIDWPGYPEENYAQYLLETYSEMLEYCSSDDNLLKLAFKSEEHYHWFLLQQ